MPYAGIVWALFVTRTTINVPSLMGCIMAIGVAMSNSILMITFANEQRMPQMGGHDAKSASSVAGRTRLRPVLMTALAMLFGMLPMSLGLGEGGEQNAPLGRAVIGGLMVATAYTLFFVPVAYSLLRRKAPKRFHEGGDVMSERTGGRPAGEVDAERACAHAHGHRNRGLDPLSFPAAFVVGVIPRVFNRQAARAKCQGSADSIRKSTSSGRYPPPVSELTYAATTQATPDAIIYARTTGYVSKRYVRHRRPREGGSSSWQ